MKKQVYKVYTITANGAPPFRIGQFSIFLSKQLRPKFGSGVCASNAISETQFSDRQVRPVFCLATAPLNFGLGFATAPQL